MAVTLRPVRFLVFATDILPLPGLPTSGTALRTAGLVEGLRAHGHEVFVSVPQFALKSGGKRLDTTNLSATTRKALAAMEKLAFDSSNQRALVEKFSPDCVICGHWPAMMLPLKPSQALVVDLPGPHLLERHYQRSGEHVGATLAKLAVIATADYYIVSGPSQQRYFLSFILRADVEHPLERMITIPMPLSPELPKREAQPQEHYPHMLFGGVFLPWQDPSWSLRAVSQFLTTKDVGRLTLIGGQHPHYAVRTGNTSALFEELRGGQRVEMKPLLPFESFVNELARADVAVDLMEWNLERELAVTIRSTTYLWAGLPVIYNDFADLGLLVRQYDAGWCIRPGDSAALEQTLEQIASSPEIVRKKSANAQALAKREFSWDRAVVPLLHRLGVSVEPSMESDILVDLPEESHVVASQGKPARQFFVCRKNGLTRVEVRVLRDEARSRSATAVKLFALEGERPPSDSGELLKIKRHVVAEQTFAPDRLLANDWLSLELDPLNDSAGKMFMIELASQGDTEGVRPCLFHAAPYPLVSAFSGDERLERSSMCLRTAVIHEP